MKPSEADFERAFQHVSRTWPADFDRAGFDRSVAYHAQRFAIEREQLVETLRWAGVLPRLPRVEVVRPATDWKRFRRRSS